MTRETSDTPHSRSAAASRCAAAGAERPGATWLVTSQTDCHVTCRFETVELQALITRELLGLIGGNGIFVIRTFSSIH